MRQVEIECKVTGRVENKILFNVKQNLKIYPGFSLGY